MQLRGSVLSLVFAVTACSDGASRPDAVVDGFDRTTMLAHLAMNVLLPKQAAFEVKAQLLPAAIDAYCTALGTGGDASAARATAIGSWVGAVDAWQPADALLIGPAAMTEKDLRYKIY
ncbi:MAG TPA: hypothetical protein VK427_01735, partial [Kofleriaceae bacterium]|nr:hypothetical protein [Kofleriaceae bacterium]